MTTNETSETDEEWDLRTFVQRLALQWGQADILALGTDPNFERLAELAAYYAMIADKTGGRKAEAVWVVLPPSQGRSDEQALERFRQSFASAVTGISEGRATAAHIADGFDFLSLRIAPNFDGEELVALLKQAPAKAAIVVADARHYRLSATAEAEGPRIEEDVWTAHVHQLLVEVEALCRESNCYVTLDLGTLSPTRPANIELLRSVGDTGFAAIGRAGPDADETVERVSRWIDAVKSGEIGAVLKEIAADDGLSTQQRLFLNLEMYSTAGFQDQVRALLRENAELLTDLPTDQALHIARIAEAADEDDYAEALIRQVLPAVKSERDFEYALDAAASTGRRGLIDAVCEAFARLLPAAPALRRHRIAESVREGRYREAAELLRGLAQAEADRRADFYAALADGVATAGWKPADVRDTVAAVVPDYASEATIEISRALEREGRRADNFAFLLGLGGEIGGTGLRRLIRLVGNALQAGEMPATDAVVEKTLDLGLAHLANHPGDGAVRTRLASLMAPNMTAGEGLTVLLVAVMKRAASLPDIRARPKLADRPRPTDPVEVQPRLERIWRWLGTKGNGVWRVGQHPLPAAELDLPAEQVVAAILVAADHLGDRLADADDQRLMMLYVAAASAVAPLSPEPDEDLTILRTAGSKFAIAGKGQAARDLAEFAVASGGDRPARRRQALFTFADIYARLGMKTEALIALGAAFETRAEATWDQIWFETNLLFRLLRDEGMSALGTPLLERSRQALDAIGLAERDGYRVETLALQAGLASFDKDGGEDAELVALLEGAQANAETVLARRDDLLPIATVLNALLAIAKARNLAVAAPAEAMVARLIANLPAPQQQMIRATGPSPSLADVAGVAASIDEARYVDDAGYDLRHVRLMARRLVGSAVAEVDPKTLAYAVEASADHAISARRVDGTRVKVERLLAREDAPLEAAAALSKAGAAIVGMAMFDDQLATIEFEDGAVSDLTLESHETFSAAALAQWSERFPRDYMLDDKNLSPDAMRASVAALGLTRLPARSVLIADAQLQRFPPNLLTIDGNYAGFERAIGVAPSLEWLTASRALDRRGDGGARMWIPVSPQASDTATLALLAGDVQPVLERRKVTLEQAPQPSAEFAKADVAIIGAHGGLAEVNRYFRSVSNDEHETTEISDLAEMTRHARLTILFVCSGGRVDPHPETGMAIGLAKQILARGCSAVIAPAWPVPFFMARPWLEGFLEEWGKGALLLDAYHAANRSVAKSTSWDPKRSLAMTLYGDPFIRVG